VLTGEAGFSVLERTWRGPRWTYTGLREGHGRGAKTVIPARAVAKVSIRLVPEMTPAESFALFKAYVEAICPAGITLEVRLIHSGEPIVVSTDNPYVARGDFGDARGLRQRDGLRARRRVDSDCGRLYPRTGHAALLMGFGLPDDNLHAPNEKFHLANFHRGIESIVRFLASVGA